MVGESLRGVAGRSGGSAGGGFARSENGFDEGGGFTVVAQAEAVDDEGGLDDAEGVQGVGLLGELPEQDGGVDEFRGVGGGPADGDAGVGGVGARGERMGERGLLGQPGASGFDGLRGALDQAFGEEVGVTRAGVSREDGGLGAQGGEAGDGADGGDDGSEGAARVLEVDEALGEFGGGGFGSPGEFGEALEGQPECRGGEGALLRKAHPDRQRHGGGVHEDFVEEAIELLRSDEPGDAEWAEHGGLRG